MCNECKDTIVNSNRPFRILSIQGGGVRGIIPSMIIHKLEQITGCHATELFDLFIGTSTGALICSILNMPNGVTNNNELSTTDRSISDQEEQDNFIASESQTHNNSENMPLIEKKPWKYGAKDLLEVYVKEGPVTFESSLWKKMTTINGIYGPMYYTKTRDERFKLWLGDTNIKDTLKHTIITAYDMCTQSPVFFKTRKALDDDKENISLIDCVKAATAAPTVFPPHTVGDSVYIDALYGKNPALFGVIEALKHYECKLDNIYILSLGTGHMKKLQEPHKVVTSGPGFLVEVFNSTINVNTTSTTYMLQQLLHGKSQFLDLDPSLSEEHMGICDVSKSNLDYLVKITQDYINEHEDELIEFARLLVQNSN